MEQVAPQPRKFGLSVGSVLLLFATLAHWRGHPTLAMVLAAPGALLVVGGLLAPALLIPVERRWLAVAGIIGAFNTRIILIIAYYLLITPVGLAFRLFRRDPLERHTPTGATYWTRRPPEPPPSRERYARQS